MTDALIQKQFAGYHIESRVGRGGMGVVPALGTRFDAVVARAMSKRPEDRYPTAGAVGVAAQSASGGPPRRAPARIRRDDLIRALTEPFNVVVLAALLVVGAVLGAVAVMIPPALLVFVAGVAWSYRNG